MTDQLTHQAEDLVGRFSELLEADQATQTAALEMFEAVQFLKKQTREVEAQMKELLLEYIEEHGEIDDGRRRFYRGKKTKTYAGPKPPEGEKRDVYSANVDVLTTLTGVFPDTPDIEGLIAEALSSDAWKVGACRTLLGDRFDEVFTTETVYEAKEGKTKKPVIELKVADQKYLPKKEGSRADETA